MVKDTASMPIRERELLDWYDAHARVLPWRVPPGAGWRADPYHVWLSEVMLQQTTVAAVKPYFESFVKRWPRVEDLARAPLDDVLAAWAGLGYYARARNLHACAIHVTDRLGGEFPDKEEALLDLPGIGAYTAAAIAAIAFDRPSVVVDGNVERVMARLFGVETPLPDAKPELKKHAGSLTPKKRPGDYAQGVMDLGATICTPRNPDCPRCPWKGSCTALRKGIAETLPRKVAKTPKPTRNGIIYWLEREDGAVLTRKRPEKGLLAKMTEFPSVGWNSSSEPAGDLHKDAPLEAPWEALPGLVRHTFTHFHLELTVARAKISGPQAEKVEGDWVKPSGFGQIALPTVMRKVAAHVLEGDGPLFARN